MQWKNCSLLHELYSGSSRPLLIHKKSVGFLRARSVHSNMQNPDVCNKTKTSTNVQLSISCRSSSTGGIPWMLGSFWVPSMEPFTQVTKKTLHMEMNGRNIQAMLKKIVALVLEVALAAQDSVWSALSCEQKQNSVNCSVLLIYFANSHPLLPLKLTTEMESCEF